jgi:hypothetical protein
MPNISEPLGDEPVVGVPWSTLKPYMSVIVLECTAEEPVHSFGALVRILQPASRIRSGKSSRIVAVSDLIVPGQDDIDGVGTLESLELDQLYGYVREETSKPGWATDSSEYVDVHHELVVALRRGNLVAVRADGNTIDRLQRALDKPPRPQLLRLSSEALEATFMKGAAKSLWLRSVGRRSSIRPNSKMLGGTDLNEALDPIDDSMFAMGSARCEMPTDEGISFVKGSVGVTVRNSQIWFKDSSDFRSYALVIGEILDLIRDTLSDTGTASVAFPYLAQEVKDLKEVFGAYEVVPVHPDELPAASSDGDELLAAAILLQDAVLEVNGVGKTDRFLLDVGLDGSASGTLAAKLKDVGDKFILDIGIDTASPHILAPAEEVRAALGVADLLEVYYESGHKYSGGKIWKQNFTPGRFGGWEFEDFAGFDITREKPKGAKSPQAIHDAIAEDGDTSLFAWLVQYCNAGWLICDDGSGEAADFFHLDNDDKLRVFHVKGAKTAAPKRQVRVTDYEVVVSQASKNLLYMDRSKLIERLGHTTLSSPACWTQGVRVDDKRAEFIEMLTSSKASGSTEIVVIQPHLSKVRYDKLIADDVAGKSSQNLLRLRLLEMLLKAAHSSIVKFGADLKVLGSTV